MTKASIILPVVTLAITFCSAQNTSRSPIRPPMAYELYSWQAKNGGWNFSLLLSPSGVNIGASQVFNQKSILRGVSALNTRVSTLPAGATIYWLDHLTGSTAAAKSANRLSYPPEKIVGQVRHVAEARHVEITILDR